MKSKHLHELAGKAWEESLLDRAADHAMLLYKHFKHIPPQAPQARAVPKPKAPPKPVTEASRLTGVQVDPALNKRPVTGIMIENSPDARPQRGNYFPP